MIVYILIFGLTLFLYFYINGFEGCRSKIVSKPKTEKSADLMENTTSQNSRIFSNFDSADVVTTVGPQNICIGIFKNPVDHRTHFYRTRLKGVLDDGCPIEVRNIAATLRLWGSDWENINMIKISEPECSPFEEPTTKWIRRHVLE